MSESGLPEKHKQDIIEAFLKNIGVYENIIEESEQLMQWSYLTILLFGIIRYIPKILLQ